MKEYHAAVGTLQNQPFKLMSNNLMSQGLVSFVGADRRFKEGAS